MTSHPPRDKWTAADIENQWRVAAEVERQIKRGHIWMTIWTCAVAVAIAAAIHFLSKP